LIPTSKIAQAYFGHIDNMPLGKQLDWIFDALLSLCLKIVNALYRNHIKGAKVKIVGEFFA